MPIYLRQEMEGQNWKMMHHQNSDGVRRSGGWKFAGVHKIVQQLRAESAQMVEMGRFPKGGGSSAPRPFGEKLSKRKKSDRETSRFSDLQRGFFPNARPPK